MTHRLFGAQPFASDAGGVQRLAGVLFVLAGAAAYRLPGLTFPVRALLATAGAWLAVDEWLMVHECLKFGPLAALGPGRDAPILLYAAGGAAAAISFVLRLRPPREALLHVAAATLAVAAVLLLDVAGIWKGPGREVIEETAELLAAWGAIQCAAAAARTAPSSPWGEAVAVSGWSAVWLGATVWLLKPLGCAERFL